MAKAEIKRQIPFDQPLKILIMVLHSIGFSGWFGGLVVGADVPGFFLSLTTLSGVLLVVRELYKEGWAWPGFVEGGRTIFKVVLLVLSSLWRDAAPMLLGIILICGLLSSHLPKGVKERGFLGRR